MAFSSGAKHSDSLQMSGAQRTYKYEYLKWYGMVCVFEAGDVVDFLLKKYGKNIIFYHEVI